MELIFSIERGVIITFEELLENNRIRYGRKQ